MSRCTEEMKLWLFDLAHDNLSDHQVLQGFIQHYVMYDYGIGNVQDDIIYRTIYGADGCRLAMDRLRDVLARCAEGKIGNEA